MKCFATLCWIAAAAAAHATPLARNFAVEHYDVLIQPDLASKSLTGEVSIRLHSRIDRLSAVELDAGALEIGAVTVDGAAQYKERRGALLIVVLSKALNDGEQRTMRIQYRAPEAKGLVFSATQVYGSFFTSDWLPSSDRPDDPATLRLRIAADPKWKVAGSGKLAGTNSENGRSVTEWKIETPMPTYLFGFAAGEFAESVTQQGKVSLRILGPAGLAATPIAEATGTALQFFNERIGVPYGPDTYTEVFVPGDVQQSAVGMSLLPVSYGEKVAAHSDDLGPLAQSLANQWYGVGLRCANWSDFWLSAGVSTFMAVAYLEKRFGKARYEKAIEKSRGIFESWQADGKDRPLSWGDWQTPLQAMGDLPYHKGAVVMDELRRLLGDDAFWKGLHRFTSEYWGKAVTSDNLEAAMSAASGKSKAVTNFFEKWVTGCCANLSGRGKK